ncbi:hypothetical protein N7G274_001311 [Stereocaulon virgatum]|uniref:DUF7730 domain-containing protein n=1 Tax=Stereocaulon virgatum TaxID=373712 RepID=A0ABR4AP18_9LECA
MGSTPRTCGRALMTTAPQPQLQSPLLTNLPFELRQFIYQSCLGGHQISLFPNPKRLNGTGASSPQSNLLALLLTCKQIYTEAISTLYTHNIFSTSSLYCILHLNDLILPQRVNTIRSFTLYWTSGTLPQQTSHDHRYEYTSKYTQWAIVWANLAAMQGLEDLRVELGLSSCWQSGHHERRREDQAAFWEPVKAVARPRNFILKFLYPVEVDEDVLKGMPCVVERCSDGDGAAELIGALTQRIKENVRQLLGSATYERTLF